MGVGNNNNSVGENPEGTSIKEVDQIPRDVAKIYLDSQTCYNDEKLSESHFGRADIKFLAKKGNKIIGFIAGTEHELGVELTAISSQEESITKQLTEHLIEEVKSTGKSRLNLSDERPTRAQYQALQTTGYEIGKIDCDDADYTYYYIDISEEQNTNKQRIEEDNDRINGRLLGILSCFTDDANMALAEESRQLIHHIITSSDKNDIQGSELIPALATICKAAKVFQELPELSGQTTEICIRELGRVAKILGIDGEIQVKRKRKPGVSQFKELMQGNNIEELIQKVYIDITRTNYLSIKGTNRRDIFLLVIQAYFERNNIKYSQKDIIKVLERYGEPMSTNTISLVFKGKQGNNDDFIDFINAYISGEYSTELKIKEIY